MAGHVRSPRPRDVPGFAEAAAAGLTPPRPSRPPSLLPGTTSPQALVRCGQLTVGECGGIRDRDRVRDRGACRRDRTVPAGSAGRARRRVRVTTTFHQGLFWFVKGPGPAYGDDLAGWVWDGVWVLTSAGGVVSTPDPTVDPPGFYPSSNRPGQSEFWTGAQWLGVHADTPAAACIAVLQRRPPWQGRVRRCTCVSLLVAAPCHHGEVDHYPGRARRDQRRAGRSGSADRPFAPGVPARAPGRTGGQPRR